MRLELLEKAHKVKEEISNLAINFNKEILEKDVFKRWFNYTPKAVYKSVLAEDGSLNFKYYLGFYLYAVGGYSVCYKGENTEEMYYEEALGEVNLSVIKKNKYLDVYLKLLMFLLEIKSTIKLAHKTKPEVIILDGTLSSKFITIFPKTDWFSNEDFGGKLANIATEFTEDIKNNLFYDGITSFSKEIKEKVLLRLIKEFGEKKGSRKDILEATLSKMAFFEYLFLLHHLFYKLDWNPLIIGVGKTSSLTEIFKSSIPDIKIFLTFIKETGYSIKREKVSLDENIKWEFSELFEAKEKHIENELREVIIDYFYCKLDKGRNIILVEIFENPNLENKYFEQDYILDILSYYSVGGYPFLLKKADREVRITHKDMELVEQILGLQNEIHGREALE